MSVQLGTRKGEGNKGEGKREGKRMSGGTKNEDKGNFECRWFIIDFLMDYRVFFFIIIIVFKHFYLFIVIVIYLIITSVYRMRICNVSYYFQNYERR